jgi:hypothetical protein
MAETDPTVSPGGSSPTSTSVRTTIRAMDRELGRIIEWGLVGSRIEGEALVAEVVKNSRHELMDVLHIEQKVAVSSVRRWIQIYNTGEEPGGLD